MVARVTSSVYAVLVPKIAIPDLVSLRKKACELAREYGLCPSQYWYAPRGEQLAGEPRDLRFLTGRS